MNLAVPGKLRTVATSSNPGSFTSGDQWSNNWHKLKPWMTVQNLILSKLNVEEADVNEDISITHGFLLVKTLDHSERLRHMTYLKIPSGLMFISSSGTELRSYISVWNVQRLGEVHASRKKIPVVTNCQLLKYIPKYKKVVTFSPDLKIKLLDDVLRSFDVMDELSTTFSLFCIEYNPDTDAIICGGVGGILLFRITENFKLAELPPYKLPLAKFQWCTHIMVDTKNKQLLIICDDSILLYNYENDVCTHTLQNRHSLPLTCCAHYEAKDYFITGSKDGTVKIWNGLVLTQVQELIAHTMAVTAMQLHKTEPLLLTTSLDGSIKIWRLDTFDMFMRMDVDEKIKGLQILNSHDIFIWTEKSIKTYRLNMLYSFYAAVYSTITTIKRLDCYNKQPLIMGAGSDGTFRILTALTAEQYTTIFPPAQYKVSYQMEMLRPTNEILLLLGDGDVAVYDAKTNPCEAKYILHCDKRYDEQILAIAMVKRDRALGKPEGENCESLIFAGHKNGEISLLHSGDCKLLDICRAHLAPVEILACSSGKIDPSLALTGGVVGVADRLISYAADQKIKVWGLIFEALDPCLFTLICLKIIDLTEPATPIKLCMVGSTLAVAMPTLPKDKCSRLLMFWLSDHNADQAVTTSRMTSRKSSVSIASIPTGVIKSSPKTGICPLFHSKSYDHEDTINGLDGHALLGIFVTTSWNGVIKIWDKKNNLIRELQLQKTLSGVCFADDKGTLIIGYKNHLSNISVDNYLPVENLRTILLHDFKDPTDEPVLPFRPEFMQQDYQDLPRRPAVGDTSRNVRLNRDFRQADTNTITPEELEEKAGVGGRSSRQTNVSKDDVWRRLGVSQKTARRLSGHQTSTSTKSSEDQNTINASTPPTVIRKSARKKFPVPKEDLTVEPAAKMTKLEFDVAVSRLSKQKRDEIEEHNKRRTEVVRLKEMERKKREKFYPLAPDGEIPNSVIRAWMAQLCGKSIDSDLAFTDIALLISKLPGMGTTQDSINKFLKKQNKAGASRKLIPEKKKSYSSYRANTITLVPDNYESFMEPITWSNTEAIPELTHVTMRGDAIIDLSPKPVVAPAAEQELKAAIEDREMEIQRAQDVLPDRRDIRTQGIEMLKKLMKEKWWNKAAPPTVAEALKQMSALLPKTTGHLLDNFTKYLFEINEIFSLPDGSKQKLADALIRNLKNNHENNDAVMSILTILDELRLEGQSTMKSELERIQAQHPVREISMLAEKLVNRAAAQHQDEPPKTRPPSAAASLNTTTSKRTSRKTKKIMLAQASNAETRIVKRRNFAKLGGGPAEDEVHASDSEQTRNSTDEEFQWDILGDSTLSRTDSRMDRSQMQFLPAATSPALPLGRNLQGSRTSIGEPDELPENTEKRVQHAADKFLATLEHKDADEILPRVETLSRDGRSTLLFPEHSERSSRSVYGRGERVQQSYVDQEKHERLRHTPTASAELVELNTMFNTLTMSQSELADASNIVFSNDIDQLHSDLDGLTDSDVDSDVPESLYNQRQEDRSKPREYTEAARLTDLVTDASDYNYQMANFMKIRVPKPDQIKSQPKEKAKSKLPPIESTGLRIGPAYSVSKQDLHQLKNQRSKIQKRFPIQTETPTKRKGLLSENEQLIQRHLKKVHGTKQSYSNIHSTSDDAVGSLIKDLWGVSKANGGKGPLSSAGPARADSFEWDTPMPPAPDRLDVQASLQDLHSKYCEYWRMVKKKMQNYVSTTRDEPYSLPQPAYSRRTPLGPLRHRIKLFPDNTKQLLAQVQSRSIDQKSWRPLYRYPSQYKLDFICDKRRRQTDVVTSEDEEE